MPRLTIHYDLRHPAEFAVSGADLYAAALGQIDWAEAHGFSSVGFGEHHQSPDGYLPAPLMVAAAVGARFSPLLAGIDPAWSNEMLALVEREVLPALSR